MEQYENVIVPKKEAIQDFCTDINNVNNNATKYSFNYKFFYFLFYLSFKRLF